MMTKLDWPIARMYPVIWDHSYWDNVSSLDRRVYPDLVDLIDGVAAVNGRSEYVDREVDGDLNIQMSVVLDGSSASFGQPNTFHRRAMLLAHNVQRTIRILRRTKTALIVEEIPCRKGDSSAQHSILIRPALQDKSVSEQIKELDAAIKSGSAYEFEVAWFGLTYHAHKWLEGAYEFARRKGDLRNFNGESDVRATLISVRIRSPVLLKIIVPYAILAAKTKGRRPDSPRDEALAALLRIYNEMSGSMTGSARLGGFDEPAGPGADFVRKIEGLFGVQIMAAGSTHGISRAKRLLAKAQDR